MTFDVAAGTGLGIIGSNGAGKTTLLKLISRVTWPTSGRVRVAGRVVSLIELGAGFHPELTGRENVYFGGGLFGLTRREIDARFRRDRAVRGSRAADRHADEALLVGPVRAARIQRRHSQRPRHRAGGRSAGGRRRRIPTPRDRQPAPAHRRRQDRPLHLTRYLECAPPVRSDHLDGRRPGARAPAPPPKSPIATWKRSMCARSPTGTTRCRAIAAAPVKSATPVVQIVEGDGCPAGIVREGSPLVVRAGYQAASRVDAPDLPDRDRRRRHRPRRRDRIVPCRGRPCRQSKAPARSECVFESVPLRPRQYLLRMTITDAHQLVSYDVVTGETRFVVSAAGAGAGRGATMKMASCRCSIDSITALRAMS